MRVLIFAAPSALAAALLCAALPAQAAKTTKPTLELQPQSTFATGADERGKPGGLPLTSGDLRLPFKLTVPFAKTLQFIVQQKYIDETLGRVANAGGTYMYPGAYHDIATDASLAYKIGALLWSAGYFQRHRACCPYDKVEEHLVYAGIEDNFGPKVGTKTMFAFKFQGLRSVNHKESAAFLAANAPGYTFADYKGNLFIYRTSLEMRVPVVKTFALLGKAGVDSDYFDYDPIPLYYDYVNVGAEAKISPNVTYTLQLENLTQRNQGYPFVAPNAIHRTKVVLQADFKVPF